MASMSHSVLTDYPNKRICKDPSSSVYNPTNNNMQDLYAFMNTLHPHLQASPAPYINIAKPFYYSSNVQGLNKMMMNTGEDEPSLITNASTSWADQAISLHQHSSVEASESKALISSGVGGENIHVNAGKKRIRAVMDYKDADHKDVECKGETKRMKGSSSGDANVPKSEVKPTNSNVQKLRGNIPDRQHNTEQKSSEIRSNVNASGPTTEQDMPTKPDFIHVRARRGQATDSHSLAERVRREKISERMKYLQDLVPGCVKVTGKAMMLDEIINYVQSLQRQVEFLSMKLAAVHPSKLEFNLDNLFGKKVVQPNNLKDGGTLANCASMPAFAPPIGYQGNIVDSSYCRDTFCDSIQLHEVDPGNVLQTSHQVPCSPAGFLTNLHPDLDEGLMHRTAASSSCCLTTSTTDSLLQPAHHSCISVQNSQSEPDWDDELQNIVQQMGFLSQTSSLFLPHQLNEGLFLQSQMKPEL